MMIIRFGRPLFAAVVTAVILAAYPAAAFAACQEITVDHEINLCSLDGSACIGIHWSTTTTVCT